MENFKIQLKSELKENKELVIISLSFIAVLIINLRDFIFNAEGSFLAFLFSMIYLGIWIYTINKAKKEDDILFFSISTIFWIVTSIVVALYYGIYVIGYSGEFFSPIATIFLTPIYSIGAVLSPYGIIKIYIMIFISFSMIFINYKILRPLEIERDAKELEETLETTKIK